VRAITVLAGIALLQPLVASHAASPQPRQRAAPVLTIYASAPLHGAARGEGKAIENGARLALDDAGGQAAGYKIRYRPLDDSLRSTGAADEGKAAHNALITIRDETAVGYIGDFNSGISKVTIPILNKGGVAQVSPSNTYTGLTEHGPGTTPGEPAKYYPSGRRTYARLMPNDTVQGPAIAAAARDAGCKKIQVWDSRTRYSRGLAKTVIRTAKRLGIRVEAHKSINPHRPNYRDLTRHMRADCFVFTGEIESNGVQAVLDASRRRSVHHLFAGDGMCLNDVADPRQGLPKAVARRFRCTISLLGPDAYPPDSARVFSEYAKKFGARARNSYVLYGYESMSLLLDSISRAAASGSVTRRAVVKQLFLTKDRASPIGTYSIDPNGDTTITDFGLYRVKARQLTFARVVDGSP
jgi:branched-chain amino acid transport system substrate-binding protein